VRRVRISVWLVAILVDCSSHTAATCSLWIHLRQKDNRLPTTSRPSSSRPRPEIFVLDVQDSLRGPHPRCIMCLPAWPRLERSYRHELPPRTAVLSLRPAPIHDRHGTGLHFVTQRPSDPGIQRPGDPVDPVNLFYNELQMSTYV